MDAEIAYRCGYGEIGGHLIYIEDISATIIDRKPVVILI
jgi:hypothetical protein